MKKYECLGHTRGMKRTPTYLCWRNMISRCTNKNRPDYQYYGGRGISVCDRWKESFGCFLSDMGERPKNMSIDRIDNSLGYSPKNCRWATSDEQMQNTRATRRITFNGETMGLTAWARKVGINRQSLSDRIKRGWSLSDALTKGARK